MRVWVCTKATRRDSLRSFGRSKSDKMRWERQTSAHRTDDSAKPKRDPKTNGKIRVRETQSLLHLPPESCTFARFIPWRLARIMSLWAANIWSKRERVFGRKVDLVGVTSTRTGVYLQLRMRPGHSSHHFERDYREIEGEGHGEEKGGKTKLFF